MKKDNWIKETIKPDDDRVVLVTFWNPAMDRRYIGFAWYCHADKRWKMNDKGSKVLAWQERPEVYKD